MSWSARPVLLAACCLLNFGVIGGLLAAAFFLSQGLFGDLYSCNEKATAQVEQVRDDVPPVWGSCLVDLNYTAQIGPNYEEQEFYSLEVAIPCDRLYEDEAGNGTVTFLCYNRYHPQYFASLSIEEKLTTAYTHDEAVRDMHQGFRAALWMALFGFLSSAVYRNLDDLDKRFGDLQDAALQALKHARAGASFWRHKWTRRTEERAGESELQAVSAGARLPV